MKKKRTSREPDSANHVLVYSTDSIPPKRCGQCLKVENECRCSYNVALSQKLKPAVRLEKKGRGGKSVTVLFKLPAHETFLKELCAHLKGALGTGGTSYVRNGEGFIEIQGDRRDEVLQLVEKYQRRD